MPAGIALITGCSSGIGRELARQLATEGWTVYAGARRPEALADLAGEKLLPVMLDVTDPEQIRACRERIEREASRLDLLVNNAGYGAMGPLAEMPLEQVRRQFDTNVFAPLALVQALLPLLQAGQQSLVVNIGSVSGILTTPFSGAYCASKAAVHALSDALRIELSPFGIRVLTVQPGAIASEFGNNAESTLAQTLPANSRYQPIARFIRQRAQASQQNSTPTGEFVSQLMKTLNSGSKPAVTRIGKGSTLLPLIKQLLPTGLIDRLLARKFSVSQLR